MPGLVPSAARLLDLVAPRWCAVCSAGPVGPLSLCNECEGDLGGPVQVWELGGVPICAALPYQPPVAVLIHALKYKGRRPLAGYLGRLLLRTHAAFEPLRSAECLVPVPLHARRHKRRGFNQAEELAGVLGAALNLPTSRLLRRRRHQSGQVGRSGVERRQQASDLFELRRSLAAGTPPTVLDNRRVVVVDDVFTTGTTMRGALSPLVAAGARPAAVVLCVAGRP